MPEAASISHILEFSKMTGDYVSISPTDGQVISLAHQLLVKRGKDGLLRAEPKGAKECISGKVFEYGQGDIEEPKKDSRAPVMLSEDEEEDDQVAAELIKKALEESDVDNEVKPETQEEEKIEVEIAEPEPVEVPVEVEVAELEPVEVPVEVEVAEPEPVEVVVDENGEEKVVENGDDDESKPYNPNIWVDGKDWDTDDEDGWVNPDNFNQLVLGKEVIEKEKQMEDMGVFIMTSDYAMQVPQFPLNKT
jgi:outer membrane biosynthesis protein TonB